MIFLIEYDRQRGQIVTFRTYEDAQQTDADSDRIALEVDRHHRGVLSEVVLLEAASEAALRRTHRRYFEGLQALTSVPQVENGSST
jgi:hypothetical protein